MKEYLESKEREIPIERHDEWRKKEIEEKANGGMGRIKWKERIRQRKKKWRKKRK